MTVKEAYPIVIKAEVKENINQLKEAIDSYKESYTTIKDLRWAALDLVDSLNKLLEIDGIKKW